MKKEINLVKTLIEEGTKDKNVKVVYAEKQEWLLLKTMDRSKTFGAIRFNKNSFVTMYLDTKEGYKMSDMLENTEEFKNRLADVQSREIGNFVQNKIKIYTEDASHLINQLIIQVMEDDSIHITKKIRNKTTA